MSSRAALEDYDPRTPISGTGPSDATCKNGTRKHAMDDWPLIGK
jgi:hypothetical protein